MQEDLAFIGPSDLVKAMEFYRTTARVGFKTMLDAKEK